MASSILRIPPEIWDMILARLSSNDLHAVCLTHRYLRLHAETFLYTHIEWTWTSSQTPPITLFLRSIMHRPKLAGFVRVLVLKGDGFDREHQQDYDYEKRSPKLPVTGDVLDVLKYIKNIPVPFAERWMEELRIGTMDALVAVLLSLLPHLRRLYLGKSFARESQLISMMLRSALCEPLHGYFPPFTHLQDVTVVYPELEFGLHEYTDFRNTVDALTFFYLPSVERIKIEIDNPDINFQWPGNPPDPKKLTSLGMTTLREGHLGQLLSVTRGLRKLRWDWFYCQDFRDAAVTETINLDQLAMDLSHVQDTLTDLTITAIDRDWPDWVYTPFLGLRGYSTRTFRNLHALERLEVPIPFLLGFCPSNATEMPCLQEALPKNIQWLTLTDDFCLEQEWKWEAEGAPEYLLEAVESWLKDWRQVTPRLRGVCLLGRVSEVEDWDCVLIQGLRDLGIQAGIQIQVLKDDNPPKLGRMFS